MPVLRSIVVEGRHLGHLHVFCRGALVVHGAVVCRADELIEGGRDTGVVGPGKSVEETLEVGV